MRNESQQVDLKNAVSLRLKDVVSEAQLEKQHGLDRDSSVNDLVTIHEIQDQLAEIEKSIARLNFVQQEINYLLKF